MLAGMGPSDMPDPLARRGILIGLVAFFVGVVGSAVFAGLYSGVTGSDVDSYGVQLAGLPGLWVGLFGVPWLASRRWGTGSLRHDYGLEVQLPVDLVVGALAGLAAQLLVGFIIVVFRTISPGLKIDETSVEVAKRTTGAGFVILVILVAILAPIVEELFFRGLVQGSLQRSLGPFWAVAITGVLFGLVHFGGSGWGAVALVASLAAFGWAVGWLTVRYRRLGPAIVAHMMFNAIASAQIIADSVKHH
jgi:membrane protease YdiL (CAAX protease family)